MIVIVVANSILIFAQSFADELLVVDVTTLHVQCSVQSVGGNYRITHPCDVADKVFLTFIHMNVDIDMLFVNVSHRVLQNLHVTIAQLIILFYQCLLGLLVSLVSKLLGLEEVIKLSCFVNFAEGTFLEERALDGLGIESCSSAEDDITHLHLILFVDIDIEDYLILASHIIAL